MDTLGTARGHHPGPGRRAGLSGHLRFARHAALGLALCLVSCAPVHLRVAQTDRIHLTTDNTPADAYRLLRAMETDHHALVQTFFPCAEAQRGDAIEVVALVEDHTFQRVLPATSRGAAGVFISHPARVVPRPPTLALQWQRTGADTRALFRHELTHRLTARCTPQAPPWLDEGLAELLSTADVDDDSVRVGVPPYFFESHGSPVGRIGQHFTQYVPRERLLDAETLRALPPGGMWVAGDLDETLARYASAWALVAVLATGPADVRRGFADYRRALSVGTSEEEAWENHLSALPVAELYARFVAEDARSYATYPLTHPATPGPAVERPLRAREADLFWARHLSWDSPRGREEALAALDAVVRREPERWAHADIASLRAAILAEGGDAEGAAQAIRWVDDPSEVAFPRLALRLTSDYTSPPLPGGSPETLRVRRADDLTESEVHALTPRAATAFEHDVLARAWLRLAQFEAALGEAHLAVADDGSCEQCWVTLGLAQIQAGDVQRGAQSLRRGAALMGLAHGGQGTWVRRAGMYAYGAAGRRMCEAVPPFEVPGEPPPGSDDVSEGLSREATPPSAATLTADEIRTVVRSQIGSIVECYENELALTPTTEGTVQVTFTIGLTGAVINAELRDSELAGALGCCILREVMTWQFPPTGGGLVTVTYPFTLSND